MTDIKAALELARCWVDYPSDPSDLDEIKADALQLARSLLALAAEHERCAKVVEAACTWRDADKLFEIGHGDRVEGGIGRSENALADAIDAYRSASPQGTP